jgi:hypothetical protein
MIIFKQITIQKIKVLFFHLMWPLPPIHIIDIGDVIEINYYTPDEINQSIMNTSDESEKKTKINLFTVKL